MDTETPQSQVKNDRKIESLLVPIAHKQEEIQAPASQSEEFLVINHLESLVEIPEGSPLGIGQNCP